MKKLKWLLGLCLMVLVVCGSGMSVQATDVGTDSEDDANETDVSKFRWSENDDGTLTITKYVGIDETVAIPSEIEEKSVSVIGEKAFYERKDLKHITIPEEVTIIESRAFQSCENLETIQLPEGLKVINSDTFSHCKNLEYINLPDTLEIIGSYAFNDCIKLEKIIIPNKITVFGTHAFYWCLNLTEIEFSEGIRYIDLEIFGYAPLKKIIIPDSVTYIRGFDLPDNYNFTIYANPNSYARTYANYWGIKFSCLNTHDWDKGVITTEPTAIRDGVKTYTCTACKTKRTENVAKLGLPQKGKTITESSSNNDYKVTKSATKNGTVELAKISKSASSVTVPDSVTVDGVTYKVTSVSKNAFKNNKKLKKVTVGKNITKINANTFYGCKNLKTITIKSTSLKSVGKNAFKGINAKAKIKVPKSKLKSYKKLFSKKGQKSTVKIVK